MTVCARDGRFRLFERGQDEPGVGPLCDILALLPGSPSMHHLIDDFRRQPWVMKLFLLWGWLAVVIMVTSFIASIVAE